MKGKIEKFEQFLSLRVPDLDRPFVLQGGAKLDELQNKPDVLGAELVITGTLHPFHADKPPGLSVEKFE